MNKKTARAKAATGRGRGEMRIAGSVSALKLPHERDESTEAPGPKRRVIKQAAKDLAAGLVDTDNYTRAAAVAARAEARRRRVS